MRIVPWDKLNWLTRKDVKARDISGVIVFGDVHGDIREDSVRDELNLQWDALRAGQDELAWLSWRTELSGFTGRDAEKAELIGWAEQDHAGILARFVAGDGGVGKTRLAAEVARGLREQGWAAGFVDLRSPGVFYTKAKGTLALLDYPEERRQGVKTLLENLRHAETKDRVRLLFLSRRGWDAWREEIVRTNGAINFFDKEPLHLEPLHPQADAQNTAFDIFMGAQERLASVRGVTPRPVGEHDFTAWLERDGVHRRPLFIAAAAVHSVLHPEVSVVTLDGGEIIQALAQREVARLSDEGVAVGMEPEALPRLAALAAIGGSLDGARLRSLAERKDLDLNLPAPNRIVDLARRSGRMTAGVFPAPAPDIVAAGLVVDVFAQNSDQAPEWLWAGVEESLDDGLLRLSRISHDAEEVLGLLDQRISRWLERAVAESLDRCRDIRPHISETRLAQGLIPAAVAAWNVLKDNAETDQEKAELLNNLSVSLADAGDGAGALAAIREALETYRRLAASNPARFEPDLATSLNNLSVCLSEAGEGAEALVAIRDAVETYRRLAASNPARFEPDLAMSLNNLSNGLSDAGECAEALVAIREAVEIRRRLAASNPARFEPDLARSIGSLGSILRVAGWAAEAREAFAEGVRLVEPYAQKSPEGPGGRLLTALKADLDSLDQTDG